MDEEMKLNAVSKYMPWKRAQVEAIKGENSLIFPLTRNEKREKSYRWIVEVAAIPVMFINKKGQPLINTPDEARKLFRVASVTGTPQGRMLDSWNIAKSVNVPGKQLFGLLAKDKVSAVYTGLMPALANWKKTGSTAELQYGKTLQVLPLWIAAGHNSPSVKSEDWKKALKKVRDSGFFKETYIRYFGREP